MYADNIVVIQSHPRFLENRPRPNSLLENKVEDNAKLSRKSIAMHHDNGSSIRVNEVLRVL